MTAMTSAGSTLGVSATLPATYDATGYNALTYTSIGEVTDLGEVGKEYNVVNHTPLANRRTQKFKGSYNVGQMQVQMARDTTDAGQIALNTALASDNAYSFKITLQNAKKLYFTGVVTSYKTSIGSVDQITGATTNIELVTDIIEV